MLFCNGFNSHSVVNRFRARLGDNGLDIAQRHAGNLDGGTSGAADDHIPFSRRAFRETVCQKPERLAARSD